MIIGTGIDLIEIKRIEKSLERMPKFARRILTEKEYAIFQELTRHRKIEFLAGRFAAKEAFSKALGTGIGQAFSWQDIEILHNEMGRPYAVTKITPHQVHISISHSREYAVSSIIIESLSS